MKKKDLRRKITDPVIVLLVTVFSAVASIFPLSFLYFTAGIMTKAFWLCSSKTRKLSAENLSIAFPEWDEKKRNEVGCQSIYNSACSFFEFIWFKKHPDRIQEFFDAEGIKKGKEVVERCKDEGHILVTPHLGNWEIAGLFLSSNNLKMDVVANNFRIKGIDKFINETRSLFGTGVIYSKGALKGIIRSIRKKRSIGLLIDQNVSPKKEVTVFCDFFGLPASTTKGPAGLIRKMNIKTTNQVVVRKNGKFTFISLELSKPVAEFTSDDELTAEIIKCNEAIIRKFPEQYPWTYKRWRYIPVDLDENIKKKFPSYAYEVIPKTK